MAVSLPALSSSVSFAPLAGPASLVELLERAAADPTLLAALSARPLETALAVGVHLTFEDLKQQLGIPILTDAELVELLRARLTPEPTCCGCRGNE